MKSKKLSACLPALLLVLIESVCFFDVSASAQGIPLQGAQPGAASNSSNSSMTNPLMAMGRKRRHRRHRRRFRGMNAGGQGWNGAASDPSQAALNYGRGSNGNNMGNGGGQRRHGRRGRRRMMQNNTNMASPAAVQQPGAPTP